MPKPRKESSSHFSISPWQSAKKEEKKQYAAHSSEGGDYTIVHENLMAPLPTENPSDQQPMSGNAASPPLTTAPAWRTKRSKRTIDDEDAPDPFEMPPLTTYIPPPLSLQEISLDPPPPPPPSSLHHFSGTASLVVLGGSRIVGNFVVVEDQGSRSIPFHGKEITSYRDCTRDVEWSVVTLHFLGLSNSSSSSSSNANVVVPHEVVVVAERTGGDAMSLCAPVEWQGDEAMEFAGDGGGAVELHFECHSLLTGAAAEEEVRRVIPSAVCLIDEAVVNVGPMSLKWSAGGGDDFF